MPMPMPMPYNIPILLTSSVVAHDAGVALKDTDARIHYAMESVKQWLRISPELPLVLCDGSEYDFTGLIAQHYPEAKVECLCFMNDHTMVLEKGRGWGEGEIVRYAIENSQTIRSAGAFAKCTSKLWVSNYLDLMEVWNGSLLLKGVFLHVFSAFQKTAFDYIDTRFYVVSVATYIQLFVDAHLSIDQHSGHGLEQCFLDVVQKQQQRGVLTTRAPVIEGVGGGIGRAYQNPLKRRLKERLRLWLVRRNTAFKAFFIND
jgi:hypothetical protein